MAIVPPLTAARTLNWGMSRSARPSRAGHPEHTDNEHRPDPDTTLFHTVPLSHEYRLYLGSDRLAAAGYASSARTRYRISPSISAGSETVWAMCSRSRLWNLRRSRCTAALTAPSVVPSRSATAA